MVNKDIRHFPADWQNHNAIYPTAMIGSTPNFEIIEPHSGLCGWSRMTKLELKMADSQHTHQWTDLDETCVVTFRHVPDMPAMMRLPSQRPYGCQATALNI